MVALLLSLAAAAAGAQELTLPPGPADRAWAGVGPETEPARMGVEDLPAAPERWSELEPWQAWARAVLAESEARSRGRPADGRRRARLAWMAWQQGRSDDAWEHLAACTAEPGWMAAAVPYLAPGVPLDLLAVGGASPGAVLPEGLILRPALPPPPGPAAEVVHGLGRLDPREMRIDGLRVGGATLSMRVALEPDGVQVDVTHVQGEPVTIWVELPEPPDFTIQVEYLDWFRRDTVREPVELFLSADDPAHHVFGRLRPNALTWSETLPSGLSPRLTRHGLRLAAGADDPRLGELRGFAAALSLLAGCPAEVVAPTPGEAHVPWPGITLRLFDDGQRERKLAGLISLAERFAFAR